MKQCKKCKYFKQKGELKNIPFCELNQPIKDDCKHYTDDTLKYLIIFLVVSVEIQFLYDWF